MNSKMNRHTHSFFQSTSESHPYCGKGDTLLLELILLQDTKGRENTSHAPSRLSKRPKKNTAIKNTIGHEIKGI